MPKITTKTSYCWKHFSKSDAHTAKCNICGKNIKTAGNTTNMKDHLVNVHKVHKDHEVENETPNTSVAPRQVSILESFQNVPDYGVEGSKTKKINEAIVYMIAKDVQPFSIVGKQGFVNLMNVIAPRYEIPSRFKITKWVDEKFVQMKDLWKTRLHEKKLSLTTDVWTDQMTMRSFLGVTAHFLFEQEINSLTVGVLELSERHTATYLGTLERCCLDWGIEKHQVTAIITDNGANIVKAVDIAFGRKKHLPCFTHTINLIARSAIQRESINGCIGKIKTIVTFFNHSNVASDALRKLTDKVLIQDVATSWNSTYYMIDRFLELKPSVNNVVLSIRNDMTMLTGKEFELLTELITMLRPVEEATKIISGDKYCTASMVVPMVSILKEKLSSLNVNTPEAQDVKEFLLLEIDRRMGSIEQVSILAMATVLDTRFKKLHFKDPQACANAIVKIKSRLAPNDNQAIHHQPCQQSQILFGTTITSSHSLITRRWILMKR